MTQIKKSGRSEPEPSEQMKRSVTWSSDWSILHLTTHPHTHVAWMAGARYITDGDASEANTFAIWSCCR